MALTLDLFRTNYDPGTYGIRMYTSGSVVKAFNIDVNAVENINTVASLDKLTGIKLTLGQTDLNYQIVSGKLLNGYYHFTIVEESYDSGLFDSYSGTPITIILYPELSDTLFLNSDYQAILNNVTTNRTTPLIFDVDRRKIEPSVSNIQGINDGTATLAEYQELNYSSIGLTNSRYDGAKTSISEYGSSPSVGLYLFEADSYPITTPDSNICSQSLEERNFITLGLDSRDNPVPSPDNLPTATYNPILDGYIDGDNFTPASLGSNETNFTALIRKKMTTALKPGIFLQLTDSVSTIYVQVVSATFISADSIYDTYDFVVKKHILSKSPLLTGNVDSSYNIDIKVGMSDVVYYFEGNKVLPHANKKIYLGINGKILRTGDNGQVIDISSTCPV